MNEFLDYLIFKGIKKGELITSHNLAFGVIPKINAVSRSKNQEAKQKVFEGFVGESDVKEAFKAADICYKEQREKSAEIFDNLDSQVDNSHKVIIVFSNKENAEYSGLAANKLMNKYGKPILVLREKDPTKWTGSVRSPVETLERMNNSGLCSCQGHAKAHGVTIKKCNLDRFIAWFDSEDWSIDDTVINVTAEIKPEDITLSLCKEIESYATIWGEGISEPTFYIKAVIPAIDRIVYRKKTNTGKVSVADINFIKFKISDEEAELLESNEDLEIEMIVTLGVNTYNEIEYPQGVVTSWEIRKVNKTKGNWEEMF